MLIPHQDIVYNITSEGLHEETGHTNSRRHFLSISNPIAYNNLDLISFTNCESKLVNSLLMNNVIIIIHLDYTYHVFSIINKIVILFVRFMMYFTLMIGLIWKTEGASEQNTTLLHYYHYASIPIKNDILIKKMYR